MLPTLPAAPDKLENEKVRLTLEKTVPADEVRGLVPYYHYRIRLLDGTDIGHINFRIGDTPHITLAAGHIGFEIKPDYRGRAFSYHACMAIAPLVQSVYPAVILTANPDNTASCRIIEKLGAKFIDVVQVPENDPHYASGARTKRRYEWQVLAR